MVKRRRMAAISIFLVCAFLFAIFVIVKSSSNAPAVPILNEKTSFVKSTGDIFIPPDTRYILNFYFNTDSSKKNIEEENNRKGPKISFNNSDVEIIDHHITLIDAKTGLCELTLYLNVNKNLDLKLEKIEIDEKQYDVGPIRIHSSENEDFDIISNYALAKEFTMYNATIKTNAETPISIASVSCGEFQRAVKSCLWTINGVPYDSDDVKQINLETNDTVELSIELDKDAVSDEYKVILLSPKIEYYVNGGTNEYDLPYCIYNRIT
ncbi:hypothetical protein [Bacilliculturomica massiliensis]|uniref:hypothetical protein n=1 Tax=Bacilliculturomica massiliensis TaxID=1917867 RepID=UPI0010317BF4|nr:hypothetical protein [Bacilliculturomica massiliensis]